MSFNNVTLAWVSIFVTYSSTLNSVKIEKSSQLSFHSADFPLLLHSCSSVLITLLLLSGFVAVTSPVSFLTPLSTATAFTPVPSVRLKGVWILLPCHLTFVTAFAQFPVCCLTDSPSWGSEHLNVFFKEGILLLLGETKRKRLGFEIQDLKTNSRRTYWTFWFFIA